MQFRHKRHRLEDMVTHFSNLPWKDLRTEGWGGDVVYVVARSDRAEVTYFSHKLD